jgi:hypothetical protein
MKNKGNDGSGNNPERDEWQTESKFWNKLNQKYNFTFDCCAQEHNAKTECFSNDFLKMSVYELRNHVAWMNPPFSKAREMFEHFLKVVEGGVAIYRFDNPETKLWQEVIFRHASWIFIPMGRVSYTPFDINMRNGLGTRFPSALIGFNVEEPIDLPGTILKISR